MAKIISHPPNANWDRNWEATFRKKPNLTLGDRVKTIEVVRDLTFAAPVLPEVTGKLITVSRIQDGVEVWCMLLDKPINHKRLLCVLSTQIEKLS